MRATVDSMVEAGIFDNDILIVDKCLAPFSEKIVVAMIEGEFTVKRFIKRDTKLWLEPANPNYQPIEIKNITTERWS